MRTPGRHRKLLLSTATLMGALSGYSRSAHAACVPGAPPTFVCSGANVVQQNIALTNATVSTVPGFSVITGAARGVNITGVGALSFTDAYSSTLTASGFALYVFSNGDALGTPGSITVNTDGALTGGTDGIFAINLGSGAVDITTDGDVTGTARYGILAAALAGGGADLTVTTGASTDVTGGRAGILAFGSGSGATSVTANGDVTGTATFGIDARHNSGTDLIVTTGSGTTVSGGIGGIRALNSASGATTITADGDVAGTTGDGIYANNAASATDLTVTANTVTGGSQGIFASNDGSGALQVTANGDVTGTLDNGIYALNAGTDLTMTTGAGTTITGGSRGIRARNDGSGALQITANGHVTGTLDEGIYARNDGTNLSVTTGAGTTVTGRTRGIAAFNNGSGALAVTADSNVSGATYHGIYAYNAASGTDLSVTTGAGSTVTGNDNGIRASNFGSGALSVTADGDVAGTAGSGIQAQNQGSTTDVTTAAGTTVTGNDYGIIASTSGDTLTVTANGDVSGTTLAGIFTENVSAGVSDIEIVTGAGTTVTGATMGVGARSYSKGAVSITTHGDVTGALGIYAYHFGGGPIDIAVGANSTVTSNGAGPGDFAVRTYYGPTSLTVAGTLNAGGGGAIQFDQAQPLDDRLELHPTATINGDVLAGPGTDTLVFGGTGNGAFDLSNIDTGGGIQQFQAFETFEVDSGTWRFSGATTVPFTVSGGTVKGTGTFGDLTFNGGTLAPGNSIGTMIVNGAFTLGAGAVFEVEVNAAGQGDKVIVNGTVNLTGATLRVLAANGDYKPTTDYVIIDNDGADAVVGTFGAVTSSLAFLTPTVIYDGGTGNDVVLTLERNEVDPCDVANTENQSATCDAIDPNNPLFPEILRQTAEGARQAFDALSGEIHATVAGVLADDSRYVREAILGRLMQAGHTSADGQVAALGAAGTQVATLNGQAMALSSPQTGSGKSLSPTPSRDALAFWTRGFGAWGDFDTDGNAAQADRDLGGFVSGMDASIGGSWRAGLATGASFSNVDVDDRYSSADVESYHLGGYLGGMAGAFALRGGGIWAWNEIDTSRAVIFPGFFERQKASYDADTGQIFGEVAYPTQVGGIAVEPFGGLAYVSVDTDSFRERGGALAALRGVDTDQDVGYSTLGLRAATTMYWGAMLVTPHISAAWQHAFDDVTPGASLAFASTGIGFGVDGVPLAEDSALIGAGLDLALGPNASAGVSYSGQFADNVTDNAVKGRFTWLF